MKLTDERAALSRRRFLQRAAALASVSAAVRRTSAVGQTRNASALAYVGGYTPNGKGIYIFRLNPSTGGLTPIGVFQNSANPVSTTNPSWLTLHPRQPYLYAANEIANFNGTTTGAVSAFAIAPNGDLRFLNTVSSRGADPAHISVHPSGNYLLVSNYTGGNIAVVRILSNGSLGDLTDLHDDAEACTPAPCPVGPNSAAQGPPGSFAEPGHDAPHAHMIQSDAAGKFIIVNDLGLDRTLIWKFDAANGKLLEPRTVSSSPGAGPRHFALHPNGRWLYSLNEQASTLGFMTYDPATGSLTPVREISALPPGFAGTNSASEVMVSQDGKFVYAGNRVHDSVAIFALASTGEPTLVGEEWTRGDYPRSFNFDPSGAFLYVCNQKGDNIALFRVADAGRKLNFTGQYIAVGSPACIAFFAPA